MKYLVVSLLIFSYYGHGFIPIASTSIRHRLQNKHQLSMSASTLGGSDPTNRALYNVETATAVDTMNSVDQTWGLLEDFGDILTRYTRLSLFFRSLYGGLFIGIGGILTASGSLTTQSHNYTTYHPIATHNPPFPSPSLPSSASLFLCSLDSRSLMPSLISSCRDLKPENIMLNEKGK